MRDEQVALFRNGFLDYVGGDVQAEQDAGHFGVAVVNLQARVVPVVLCVQRSLGFYEPDNVVCGHRV